MTKNYKVSKDKLCVRMPKEVDHHIAEQMRTDLESIIVSNRIREIEFDFSDTLFMDSSGIGMLIGRYKTMQMYNGTVCISNVKDNVQKIIIKSGLTRIFNIKETE